MSDSLPVLAFDYVARREQVARAFDLQPNELLFVSASSPIPKSEINNMFAFFQHTSGIFLSYRAAPADTAFTTEVHKRCKHAQPVQRSLRKSRCCSAAVTAAGHIKNPANVPPGNKQTLAPNRTRSQIFLSQRPDDRLLVRSSASARRVAVFRNTPSPDRVAREGGFILVDSGGQLGHYVNNVRHTYGAG